MEIPLVFEGNFTKKYFKKFHLPKTQFQLLEIGHLQLGGPHQKNEEARKLGKERRTTYSNLTVGSKTKKTNTAMKVKN